VWPQRRKRAHVVFIALRRSTIPREDGSRARATTGRRVKLAIRADARPRISVES
jgi:hypothetical protein